MILKKSDKAMASSAISLLYICAFWWHMHMAPKPHFTKEKRKEKKEKIAGASILYMSQLLKPRPNGAKSIAGSPCGDRGLESCKNPAAIRRFGTHPGLIRR